MRWIKFVGDNWNVGQFKFPKSVLPSIFCWTKVETLIFGFMHTTPSFIDTIV